MAKPSKNENRKQRYKAHPPRAAANRIKRLEAYIAAEGENPSRQPAHERRVRIHEQRKGQDPAADARRERYIAAHDPKAGKNPRGVELAKQKLEQIKRTGKTKAA